VGRGKREGTASGRTSRAPDFSGGNAVEADHERKLDYEGRGVLLRRPEKRRVSGRKKCLASKYKIGRVHVKVGRLTGERRQPGT